MRCQFTRVTTTTGAVKATITNSDAPDACGGMGADDTSVWLTQSCDGEGLWRIDPTSNSVATTILLPGVGGDVQVGLAAQHGASGRRGFGLTSLATDGGSGWVPVFGSDMQRMPAVLPAAQSRRPYSFLEQGALTVCSEDE